MSFTKRYLTNNPCFKAGRVISVTGLMLHSVGCSQPNPMVFINNWDRAEYLFGTRYESDKNNPWA